MRDLKLQPRTKNESQASSQEIWKHLVPPQPVFRINPKLDKDLGWQSWCSELESLWHQFHISIIKGTYIGIKLYNATIVTWRLAGPHLHNTKLIMTSKNHIGWDWTSPSLAWAWIMAELKYSSLLVGWWLGLRIISWLLVLFWKAGGTV